MDFSQQFSKNIQQTGLAAQEIQQAYNEINGAMGSSPTVQDKDNVVRQALMEKLLRRDIDFMLSAICRLRKSLLVSVNVLIRSGDEALAVHRVPDALDEKSRAVLDHAEKQLEDSLEIAKNIFHHLSNENPM